MIDAKARIVKVEIFTGARFRRAYGPAAVTLTFLTTDRDEGTGCLTLRLDREEAEAMYRALHRSFRGSK